MPLYVIAKHDDSMLNWPTFHAGHESQDEAIAVFTSSKRAEEYVRAAGWQETETIAELKETVILKWLMNAESSGANLLVIDPVRDTQSETPQPVVLIDSLLKEVTQTAMDRISAPAPPVPPAPASVQKRHCQKFGKVLEIDLGETIPECCDEKMSVAAVS